MNKDQLKLTEIFNSFRDKVVLCADTYYVHRSVFLDFLEKTREAGMYLYGLDAFIINDKGIEALDDYIAEFSYGDDALLEEKIERSFKSYKTYFENIIEAEIENEDLYLEPIMNIDLPIVIELIESARDKKSNDC